MLPLGLFAADRRVVVGVSGGADSTALALLLSRWGDPLATIVDHGLRAEAAAESEATAQRLAAIGIPAVILRAHLRPGPAAAERAREARYQLLLDLCQQTGRPDLLLAHHASDQAETVRMRKDAGSGARGLAGMAALAYRSQARLVRPLLSIPPERLRATLRAAGLAWVEDPTNHDQRSLRACLRAEMDDADRRGGSLLAGHAGLERAAADRLLAESLAETRFYPEGFAVIPGPIDAPVDAPVDAIALRAIIWAISGRRYPPPQTALEPGLQPRTVHGVLLRPAGRLGPGTLVAREPSAVASPAIARPGTVWDSRFRVLRAEPGLTIGALGAEAARLRRYSNLPAVVLQGLPSLRRDGKLVAVPHLSFPDPTTCRSVALCACPSMQASGAPFVPQHILSAVNPFVGQGV